MENRNLNGYIAIYCPESKYRIKNGSHKNFVYEHLYILEQNGIQIPDGYEVHHLDGNRQNNSPSNLIVLTKADHTRLHNWLKYCDLDLKELRENRMNSGESTLYCKVCSKALTSSQASFCSLNCSHKFRQIEFDMDFVRNHSTKDIREKYNVSNSTALRWKNNTIRQP